MREILLMKRNSFVYVFKSTQVFCVCFLFTFMISCHDNYTKLLKFLSIFVFFIDAACHCCICSNDCFHSNTNGCWCAPWELFYGFIVLFTHHTSRWWISGTIYDCIKTCSDLQAKGVVFFSCLGLYNSICCFKDSAFIVGIFHLDNTFLLCHWLSPEIGRLVFDGMLTMFPNFSFVYC